MTLAKKIAVVTGAASGIGAAVAQKFAEAGATVIVADVQADKGESRAATLRNDGRDAHFMQVDLTDADSVARFADDVQRRFGAVDVLVNGAGWGKAHPFLEGTTEIWDRIINLNFVGPMRLTKALLPKMIERNGGKIINIASDAGRVGSMGETVYSGTKGGLIAFTKSLAREVARYQINVNCVCPGPTDTPLMAAVPEKLTEALKKAIPFRRLGQPDEVADAVVFFADDTAKYVTGQVLSVSGGLTMAG
jgi:2-hydroxycyclohexanecarboxyl-CoA dehydrogenase